MIYFDAAATTAPSKAAFAGMEEAAKYPGNPSSVHHLGMEAGRFLSMCREKVAASMGIRRLNGDRVLFTASGTEANCMSILGAAMAKKRKIVNGSAGTILLSAGEHPSVEMPAQRLENDGYTVVRVPTTGGALDMQTLDRILADAAAPVVWAGFMLVNNETGAVYDVKSAVKRVKTAFPDAVCHCDAVQGYGKIRFTPATLGVDTMTVSAHKIHGTRGAGALYLSADMEKQKKIVPVLPGGGQEFGYRSGTENLFAIGAFAWAAEDAMAHFSENREKEAKLRAALEEGLLPVMAMGVKTHVPENHTAGVMNLSLPGIRSEIMLNYMSGKGICISAGSACSAHAKKSSLALEAFGVPERERDWAIRISFDYTNTEEEVRELCQALEEGIKSLAKVRI